MRRKLKISLLTLFCLTVILAGAYTVYSKGGIHGRAGKEQGNTPSNIINQGFIANDGDWIYYCEGTDGKLSKVKLDKSSKTILSDDEANFINVVGDWIYYRNISDFSKIYKMKIDGTERTKLSDDAASYLSVIGDWIYYRNDSDGKKLYKINVSGKKRTKLGDDKVDEAAASGDYIYYRNESEQYKLYRIKTNGKERLKLTDDSVVKINIVGDRVYYRNDSKEYKIYSVRIDGTDRKKISEYAVDGSIASDDNFIYFRGIEEQPESSLGGTVKKKVLYRVKKDGSDIKKLEEMAAGNISSIGEWVYFTYDSLDSAMYKLKNDGSLWQRADGVTDIDDYEKLSQVIKSGIEFNITNSTLKSNYEKVKAIVAEVIKPNMTDLEKEMALHDYLVTHTKYDVKEYDNIIKDVNNYDPYVHNENSVLTQGVGVCDGYAKAMKMLLDAVGIENWLVYGQGTISNENVGHAWNMVKLDGINYHLDATWDDPVPDMGSSVRYNYFNVSDEDMKKDHKWDFDSYRKCTGSKYNYLHEMEFAVSSGNWIYFSSNEGEKFKLYKSKKDGSDKTKLNDDTSVYIGIEGDWIYFSNYSRGGHIYKIKTDGSEKREVNSDWSIDVKVDNGWIYYTNKSNGGKPYKIRTDGTSRQQI